MRFRLLVLPTVMLLMAGIVLLLMFRSREKPTDAEAIVGQWKLVEVQHGEDGEKPGGDTSWKTTVYEFRKDGTYTDTELGIKVDDGAYQLNPSVSPKSLDIKPQRSDVPLRAVYHLDGDTLKLCVCFREFGTRPKELKADAKTETVVWVFAREKGEK